MKRLLLVVLGAVALTLSGCKPGENIQAFLDALLPPSFSGPVHIEHTNTYFWFTLDVGNLHRGPAGWEFDWLVLERKGWSKGTTRLGNPPPRPL